MDNIEKIKSSEFNNFKKLKDFCNKGNRNYKLIYLGIAMGYTGLKCYQDGLNTLSEFRNFKNKENNSIYIDDNKIEPFYSYKRIKFYKINKNIYLEKYSEEFLINSVNYFENDSEFNVIKSGCYENVFSHFWNGITFPYQIVKNLIPFLILKHL